MKQACALLAFVFMYLPLLAFADADVLRRQNIIPWNHFAIHYRGLKNIDNSMRKNEFEKTENFEQRIKAIYKENSTPTAYTVQSKVPVSFFSYDADKEIFSYDRYLLSIKPFSKKYSCIFIGRIKGDHGSTVKSNAFGVQAFVKEEFEISLALYPINKNKFGKVIGKDSFSLYFPCPLDKAKKIWEHLELILDFTPTPYAFDKGVNPTFTYDDEYIKQATLDSPREITYKTYIIKAVVSRIRVIDSQSGEIFYDKHLDD